jgi:hypothetical protein
MTEQDLGSDDSEQHCCAHCGMLGGCVIFSATANNLIGRFASNRDLHTPAYWPRRAALPRRTASSTAPRLRPQPQALLY